MLVKYEGYDYKLTCKPPLLKENYGSKVIGKRQN